MTRYFTILIIISMFSFSVNGQGNKPNNLTVIDVESGLKNLSRIKTSDLGKTIRYIPLETTDDGLVGKQPVVKVLKKYIIVEHPYIDTEGTCLLFSKEDGHFIGEIGHLGQDPEAFTNCFSWTDEKEEFLYFPRMPDRLIKYDMKGKYCGKIDFPSTGLASYYLITNSDIVGFFEEFNIMNVSSNQYSLAIFGRDGSLKDTISSFYPYISPFTDDMYQLNVINGTFLYDSFGNWTRAGAMFFTYTSAQHIKQIHPYYPARVWPNNGNIRFKQDFVDTIYTVSGNKLIPSVAFHTGKYHWPMEERRSEKNAKERIFIADISENSDFIFFQCIRNMYPQEPSILYNGLYSKKTGKTMLGNNKDGIEDDLNQFMPFTYRGMSTTGEFISMVEGWEVMEWLEKHPEAKNNPTLSFLKDLDEDMNPIVILIE